jgi:hypothetical protein
MRPDLTPPAADAYDDTELEPGMPPPAGAAPVRSRRPVIWLIGAVLALTLVVLAAIVIATLEDRRSASVDIEKLPVVRADQAPYKVQPDQPGVDIPNRDKLIYGRLRGEEQPGRVERLIPEPERPMPPPLPPRPEPAEAPSGGGIAEPTSPPAPAPGPPRAADAASSAALAPTPLPEAMMDVPPLPRPRPAAGQAVRGAPPPPSAGAPAPVAAAATVAPSPVAAAIPPRVSAVSGYRLQIAALPSQERAGEEWGRLSSRHADLLGGLKPEVTRADLGDRIVYRLRVGPIASEQTARALCQSLSGRGVGCLVVAPRG